MILKFSPTEIEGDFIKEITEDKTSLKLLVSDSHFNSQKKQYISKLTFPEDNKELLRKFRQWLTLKRRQESQKKSKT